MNKVYYSQADKRWANYKYPAPSYPNATIKSSGCGITCGAMIISSSREIVYPTEMADLAKSKGYRVDGGTADAFFPYICEKWNLKMERIHSSYEAFEKCKSGYFVLMVAGAGLWTSGGHFILAVGTRGDEIQIYDPYLYAGKFNTSSRRGANVSVEGTSCYVQIDKFKQYSNIQRLWAIKVSDGKQLDEPLYTKKGETKYVISDDGLNVRKGRGTQYSIIKTLSKNTKVTVYDTVDGWSKIGNNMYVYAKYLSNTMSKTESKKENKVKTKKGKVTAKSGLNVRSGPSISSSKVDLLKNGTVITIYEEKNGWYRIGDKKWVSKDYVSITGNTTTAVKKAKVNTKSGLNVRSGPSTSNRKISVLSNGTEVKVYEQKNGWARIGDNKWVSADYLKFI